jgi:hypothetical protein
MMIQDVESGGWKSMKDYDMLGFAATTTLDLRYGKAGIIPPGPTGR